MSAHRATEVVCDHCGAVARVESTDPAYVAGWLAALGWHTTDSTDLCPWCGTERSELLDAMVAEVFMEASPT